MREIKFRGKGYDDNIWYYGDLLQGINISGFTDYFIISDDYESDNIIRLDDSRNSAIKEETIGQYIGLKDKNGKEIYEGDVLSNGYEKCLVVWIKEQAGFMLKLLDKEYENEEWTNPMIDLRKNDEIIGNIYENPELLEE